MTLQRNATRGMNYRLLQFDRHAMSADRQHSHHALAYSATQIEHRRNLEASADA